jgi:hypothetical protein
MENREVVESSCDTIAIPRFKHLHVCTIEGDPTSAVIKITTVPGEFMVVMPVGDLQGIADYLRGCAAILLDENMPAASVN